MLARDISSALEHDGITIRAECVYTYFSGMQKPQNPEEKIAQQVINLLNDIPRYSKRKITPWMLEDIMMQIDEAASGYGTIVSKVPTCAIYKKCSDEEYLEDICAMLNTAVTNDNYMSLADTVALVLFNWDLMVLERWNSTVALIVKNIVLEKLQMPLIKYAPLSEICLKWENGSYSKSEVSRPWSYINPDCGEGSDYSDIFLQCLKLMKASLRSIEEAMEQQELEGERIGKSLDENQVLNYRQRVVLQNMLEGSHVLTIYQHMDSFRISYATARSDLLGLSSMGFLSTKHHGRTIIFEASPELSSLLGDSLNRATKE